MMHLLKLREQIVPFDIDFSATDINLDFRDTRAALSDLLGESEYEAPLCRCPCDGGEWGFRREETGGSDGKTASAWKSSPRRRRSRTTCFAPKRRRPTAVGGASGHPNREAGPRDLHELPVLHLAAQPSTSSSTQPASGQRDAAGERAAIRVAANAGKSF